LLASAAAKPWLTQLAAQQKAMETNPANPP
jgi:hypothetical protein